MGIQDFWLFLSAGLLLNLTPGPDMAIVVARATRQGVRAGAAAALGIGAGCLVHVAAAALGLSAVLASSALAFRALKWIGAAYLIYIGARLLFAPGRPPQGGARPAVPEDSGLWASFLQGFWTNLLNPKVAFFFLAFLPQFIRADAPSKLLAFAVLGLVFNATGTTWNLLVAWFAGRLSRAAAFGRIRGWLGRLLGAALIALGARLALAEAR